MRVPALLFSVLLLGCPTVEGDPAECLDEAWTPGTCAPGEVVFEANSSRSHIDDYDVEITYDLHPPSSGDHRGQWGVWGEYEYLPPEHWIHNLEHGGVVLLYHPCASAETVDALREYARSRADDDGGAFRWILTPYADLPTAVAVVAWEWSYGAECVDEADIEAFVADHYRQAPEDVAGNGSFDSRWIGL